MNKSVMTVRQFIDLLSSQSSNLDDPIVLLIRHEDGADAVSTFVPRDADITIEQGHQTYFGPIRFVQVSMDSDEL